MHRTIIHSNVERVFKMTFDLFFINAGQQSISMFDLKKKNLVLSKWCLSKMESFEDGYNHSVDILLMSKKSFCRFH